MRRPGNRHAYERLLDRIRRRVPGVALRTTFIVGFPGETEADVDRLADFVRSQQFEHVGVFTYSHEEGTTAYGFEDDVPSSDKTARRNRLMRLQRDLVSARQASRIGERVVALIDGPASDHELVLKARLASQAPDIDASVYLTDCDPSRYRPGELVELDVVGAHGYDLIARPAVL
jgi:ribosomal protein S12 methylthiotransferase